MVAEILVLLEGVASMYSCTERPLGMSNVEWKWLTTCQSAVLVQRMMNRQSKQMHGGMARRRATIDRFSTLLGVTHRRADWCVMRLKGTPMVTTRVACLGKLRG